MGIVRRAIVTLAFITTLYSSSIPPPVHAWENGGETRNIKRPPYGTHDYIADWAQRILPPTRVQELIREHFNAYMIGTEAPDKKETAILFFGNDERGREESRGYGNTFQHHNYYNDIGELLENVDAQGNISREDSASRSAQEEYTKALRSYLRGNFEKATFHLGAMSHYCADVTAWPHAMGEESIHQEGETTSKH